MKRSMNESRRRTRAAAAAPKERSAWHATGETKDRRGARVRQTEEPFEQDQPHDRNTALRFILTHLRVPLACEDKRCRRSHRCVGAHRPDERALTVPCYDRHRAVLQPFFSRHIKPALEASLASRDELEDKF